MKLNWIFAAFGLVAALYGCASSDKVQQVEPSERGQRGESCQARNDCASGLACISTVCSKNDFEVAVSAKHCDEVDCQASKDCCGDKPTSAPAECKNRVSVCETPFLPSCVSTACTADTACGGGKCGSGSCTSSFAACTKDSQCQDTCDGTGFCTISFAACAVDGDCTLDGTCSGRVCDCANPDYDPLDPVCTNPDCQDVCLLKCIDERCVTNSACEKDSDCFAFGQNYCDGGVCVQCVSDDDCDTENGQACSAAGRCEKPCTYNEECPLFNQCQDGSCVETGCSSDRECILAAGQTATTDDARLAKCLPSDEDPNVYACKVPCENDGSCGSQFQVCDAGFCKFVGCDTDEECRAYLGLASETTETVPYIPRAVCRE